MIDTRDPRTFSIIGAALEVHKRLGCGFLEKVYQDAPEIEFKYMNIPYEREKHITITYRDQVIDHDYYADFVCYDNIIVELKAVSALDGSHKAQVINYLRAMDVPIGLLINFGETSLKTERLFSKPKSFKN